MGQVYGKISNGSIILLQNERLLYIHICICICILQNWFSSGDYIHSSVFVSTFRTGDLGDFAIKLFSIMCPSSPPSDFACSRKVESIPLAHHTRGRPVEQGKPPALLLYLSLLLLSLSLDLLIMLFQTWSFLSACTDQATVQLLADIVSSF